MTSGLSREQPERLKIKTEQASASKKGTRSISICCSLMHVHLSVRTYWQSTAEATAADRKSIVGGFVQSLPSPPLRRIYGWITKHILHFEMQSTSKACWMTSLENMSSLIIRPTKSSTWFTCGLKRRTFSTIQPYHQRCGGIVHDCQDRLAAFEGIV